jgi:hypothetical protein
MFARIKHSGSLCQIAMGDCGLRCKQKKTKGYLWMLRLCNVACRNVAWSNVACQNAALL